MLPDFSLCYRFPAQQTTRRIGHRVKYFFGLATNTRNVRNNRMFFWYPCMAINVNVQYNGAGLLPDIILLTQCYLHRGTCLNAMKRFRICSLLIPPKRFDIFPPITGGCSEGLGVL